MDSPVRVLFIENFGKCTKRILDILRNEGIAPCEYKTISHGEWISGPVQPWDYIFCESTGRETGSLDALKRIKQNHPEVPVFFLAGSYRNKLAFRAIQAGAEDVLTPECLDRLPLMLHKTMNRSPGPATVQEDFPDSLAFLCHELRTPLNTISLLGKLLAENRGGRLDENETGYARAILRSSDSLLEMLDLASGLFENQSEKINFKLRETKLKEMCDHLETMYRPLFRQKNLDFEISIDPSVPASIKTDTYRIEQILKNLLSNAFKFTDEGSVSLSVYLPDPGQIRPVNIGRQHAVAFAIKDTGIGISRDQQARIFEKHERGDVSTQKKYKGSGLGLTISQSIAQLLGGAITVESEAGRGSTFTFYLPLIGFNQPAFGNADRKTPSVSTVSPPQHETAGSPNGEGRLLIVDDSEMHCSALKEYLESVTGRIYSAGSARETFRQLNQHNVDCILLDMVLPDANGLDVLRQLHTSEKHSKIPVIVYTGRTFTRKEEAEITQYAAAIVYKNAGGFRQLKRQILACRQE